MHPGYAVGQPVIADDALPGRSPGYVNVLSRQYFVTLLPLNRSRGGSNVGFVQGFSFRCWFSFPLGDKDFPFLYNITKHNDAIKRLERKRCLDTGWLDSRRIRMTSSRTSSSEFINSWILSRGTFSKFSRFRWTVVVFGNWIFLKCDRVSFDWFLLIEIKMMLGSLRSILRVIEICMWLVELDLVDVVGLIDLNKNFFLVLHWDHLAVISFFHG